MPHNERTCCLFRGSVEPFGDEFAVLMDIDHFQRLRSCIREPMRHAGGDDDDLTLMTLNFFCTDREDDLALSHHEGLGIRVLVQGDPIAGLVDQIDDDTDPSTAGAALPFAGESTGLRLPGFRLRNDYGGDA